MTAELRESTVDELLELIGVDEIDRWLSDKGHLFLWCVAHETDIRGHTARGPKCHAVYQSGLSLGDCVPIARYRSEVPA